METQEWTEKSDPQDKDASTQKRWSEHCKTFLIRDSHGAIKELVFPRALDLDRPKRERTIFSSRQLGFLEDEFKQNQYLVGKERSAVAKRLGLSETQVKVWFQNRRTKHKKDNERCGEGNDVQAESKAARNVLKLLEYKTALNYNTFPKQQSTHLDPYRNLPNNNMDYFMCQRSNNFNDQAGKILDMNLKHQENILGHSPTDIKGVGLESLHEQDFQTAHLQFRIENALSNRDITTKDMPIDTVPISPSSTTAESFPTDSGILLHQNAAHSPEAALKLVMTPAVLECANSKTTAMVNNKRLETENSHCLDTILKTADLLADNTASRGLMSQEASAIQDEYHITHAKGKLLEEIRARIQSKKQGNTELSHVCTRFNPYPGFTHPTAETPQETWRNEDQVYNSNSTACRLPPLFSEGCLPEKSAAIDNMPPHSHNTTSHMNKSRAANGGMFSNAHHNLSMGQYLSNLMYYPSNIHNTYLSYQPTMVTPGQGSHNPHQLPYTNMKHYNYYVPSAYGVGIHATPSHLQILQHRAVSNVYGGDGPQQGSYSSYPLGSSQTQPTVRGLSAQHHGYQMSAPFS